MANVFYLIVIIIMCLLLIAQCYYSIRGSILCFRILKESPKDFKEKYYKSGGTRFTFFRLIKFITQGGTLVNNDFNYYVEKAKLFTILNISVGSFVIAAGLLVKKFQ